MTADPVLVKGGRQPVERPTGRLLAGECLAHAAGVAGLPRFGRARKRAREIVDELHDAPLSAQ